MRFEFGAALIIFATVLSIIFTLTIVGIFPKWTGFDYLAGCVVGGGVAFFIYRVRKGHWPE